LDDGWGEFHHDADEDGFLVFFYDLTGSFLGSVGFGEGGED
jgi:hypothetical protein